LRQFPSQRRWLLTGQDTEPMDSSGYCRFERRNHRERSCELRPSPGHIQLRAAAAFEARFRNVQALALEFPV
jgi:hypothetical protein